MPESATTNPCGDAGRLSASLLTLFGVGTLSGLTDGQLLERFLRGRGGAGEAASEAEAAFTTLVDRHGPMVLGVCRAILGDRHDAEDACQAAFLVLARRAGMIRRGDSVASWLYGAARRIAARARRDLSRRRELERRRLERAAAAEPVAPPPAEPWPELYEELDGLAEPFRAAVVLCDLEGRSYEQAAGLLGCPVGTLQSRLARGRQRLRHRLERRGIAPAVIGMLNPAAAWSPRLTAAIARAAVEAIGGGTIAGAAPAAVAILAGAEVRRQVMRRLAFSVMMLIASGVTAAAALVLVTGQLGDEPGRRPPAGASKAVTDSLHVRVVDLEGKGMPGIPVEVRNGVRPGSFATDADGRAMIPRDLIGGDGFLIARRGDDAIAWGPPNDPRPGQPAGTGTADDPRNMVLLPVDHRVEGSIVDQAGNPLAGVRMHAFVAVHPVNGSVIFQPGSHDDLLTPTVTDRAGRFAMRLPFAANVSLRGSHPRYVGPWIEVMPDARVAGPFTFEPAGGIAGRVIDAETGRPVAGAVVGAGLVEHHARLLSGGGDSTSDDQGRFLLGGLEPGVYNLMLRKVPGRPNATARAVECLRVRAGSDATADLAVIEGRPLRGFVVNRDTGEPVPGAQVGCHGPARPRSAGEVQVQKADDQGRFTFHVPPGEQYVFCMAGYANSRLDHRTVNVLERGEIDPVRLMMRVQGTRTPTTTAVMKVAGPQPVGPPTVAADDEEVTSALAPAAVPAPTRVQTVVAKAAVTEEFTKVVPRAEPVGPAAVAKAPAEAPKVRTVTGHVRDPQGRPLAGVHLQIVPAAAVPPSAHQPVTDRDGLFLFPDLLRRPLQVNLSRPGYRSEKADLPADRDEVEWTYGLVADSDARNEPAPARDEPIPPELRGRLTFVALDRRGTDYLDDGPGYTGNDLSRLPRGIHKLGETYFRIGEKMVHVQGQTWTDMPQSVKGVEVRARGEVLHFLHAVQYGDESPDLIGAYVIRYADGTTERIPLFCGRNLNDWWSFNSMPRAATGAKIAWTGSNESTGRNEGLKLQLFDMAWTNLHPEKEIASLDVLSAVKQPDPFLVAVTVQRDR